MVKLDNGKHERFVESDVPEFSAKQDDERDAEDGGHENLADVKAVGSGDIHFGIAVVDAVEAP